MGVVLWPLRGVGLAVIPLGAVAYLAALWLLGGIGPEERALLKALRRR